jgi:quercetin 2,3-dioxygenase
MITLRKASDRGHFNFGWLDTSHTFSFGDYVDPEQMGFRALRVINEDRVDPGEGFPMHGHRDMEILTWILAGALEHRDSLGNGSVIRPGELQRMSAGTGVRHSESNSSTTKPVHLLQIWILPERNDLEPSYEQRSFDLRGRENRFQLLASREGRDGSVRIHQDVELHAADLTPGASVEYSIRPGRHVWLQVAKGQLQLEESTLRAGDGVAASDIRTVALEARQASEVLLFDLA